MTISIQGSSKALSQALSQDIVFKETKFATSVNPSTHELAFKEKRKAV